MIKFLFNQKIFILSAVVFVIFAAICSASMDTIEHHYSNSIFTQYGNYFQQDWTRKYEKDPDGNLIQPLTRKTWDLGIIKIKVHPAFFDAWHLFKTLEIFFWILFGLTLFCVGDRLIYNHEQVKVFITLFILYAFTWNLVFNLFYEHFLLLS